ncbi:hypothetical protein HYPSUDRAFT_47436 [Hypholoma sublateritium FD-334 SS-4]|uniref:Uncharacterized protein n=1 Tax=Hypholoma sublateritium (strain FD-334 SS-4) TaxID=945553 RepID=A0A0D2LZJ4_HYPSF|nr:hypothetical protein HYPSUDRAFT_47436 [Hypholoma sublateritium FD-334 SS-4]
MATLNSRPRRKGPRAGASSASEVTSTTLSFHAASASAYASAQGRRAAAAVRSAGLGDGKRYAQGLGGIQVQIESLADSRGDGSADADSVC